MMINQEIARRQNRSNTKVLLTGIVTIFVLSLLIWEHFHGGVASHHILQQQNLPAISNWWNGLILPILTWFLIGRTEKRIGKQSSQVQQTNNLQRQALRLFLTGLGLGVLIATSFTNGYSAFLDNIPYIILVLSLIIPIYYAEFILGFILGMTYTFGAILPTAFILILAAIGILAYRFIRPMIMRLTMKLNSSLNKSPNR
ncbi:hypothetical protein POKO110462_13490 [Pontibacter korlensis]|uniref:Uncharacterized protein n=1 Tax=Pontibacter korlensis TaxID=400092 RepID=A0A0E3ZF15_9BACT|nr:hypothetical protein [Pontibacter korlensis]AKD04075.1 hypothetical protein PKOR_14460 [Pontibacter korlensis]